MINNKRIRETISKVVKRIVEEYQPNKIILFGSYVYGKPTEDSDVDVLVVTEDPLGPKEAYKMRQKLLREFSISVQPIFVSDTEFIETRDIIGGITYPASKYGETVYEKS